MDDVSSMHPKFERMKNFAVWISAYVPSIFHASGTLTWDWIPASLKSMGIVIKLTFSWTNLQDLASKPVVHDFYEAEYKVTSNGYL